MRIALIVTLLFLSLFADRALQLKKMYQEGRVALVIGNANYAGAQALKNPVNDAHDVKVSLEKDGFEVFYLENANRRLMIRTIDRFLKRLDSAGIGLVYYAGHGVEVNGENFLIPVDSDIESETDIKYESISMNRLIEDMQMTRSRLNILVIDACRDNPYKGIKRGGGGGLANVEAEGFFIAFATSPGKTANDGDGNHGLFTQYFLKYIDKEGMPLREVFHNVRQEVYKKSHKQQLPLVRNGIGQGDFYFVLPKIDDKDSSQKTQKPKQTKSSYTIVQDENSGYSLKVDTYPEDASIYITNIIPKYHDGIILDPGEYRIKVVREGYKTKVAKIELYSDMNIFIQLDKKVKKTAYVKPKQSSFVAKKHHKKQTLEVMDGYIYDPNTKLAWQDEEINETFWDSWHYSKKYCSELTLGGYRDWRLPTIKELFSIVDFKRSDPAIKREFKHTAMSFYWSSSPYLPDTSGLISMIFGSSDEKADPTGAWGIYFDSGDTTNMDYSSKSFVRCVRSQR